MPRLAVEAAAGALDWPSLVTAGDLVVWGQAGAEPTTLTRSLMAARARIGGFRAFVGIGDAGSVSPQFTDGVAYSSYCGAGANRALGAALDILAIPYDRLAATLGREGPVVLVSLAPGDDPDHFSFGAGADYVVDLLDSARLVIAEVSDATPRTRGEGIRRDQLDLIVRTKAAPTVTEGGRAGAVEAAIAARVAGLIEDGATLQVGLGGLPSAILKALEGHRNLGVHSGLISDAVADLARSGVITNARKSRDAGLSIGGLLGGGSGVMTWAHDNPGLELRSTRYTHDPQVLASLDRFTAINSAIEVDLTGQVNAEVADGRYVGAVGGAGAFLRGALASRGGLPIIALPSTSGSRSRIVERLSGPVSTARSDVGVIVTEHGVADLRGLDLKARRRAMLAIADPRWRDALETDPADSAERPLVAAS